MPAAIPAIAIAEAASITIERTISPKPGELIAILTNIAMGEVKGINEAARINGVSTLPVLADRITTKYTATKSSVTGSDMAVYEINRFRHKHYAVCIKCRKIVTMDNCPLEAFEPKLDDESFHVTGHNLEIFGFCKDCAARD